MIKKIVSGGQTGVDRSALDIAIHRNIPHGGWCPLGRRAEDGIIDSTYQLTETESQDYSQRTEYNVRDSDGTLILNLGRLTGGTAFTAHIAEAMGRPCLILDLAEYIDTGTVLTWIERNNIHILNIAGPRESKHPGIYTLAKLTLDRILTCIQEYKNPP